MKAHRLVDLLTYVSIALRNTCRAAVCESHGTNKIGLQTTRQQAANLLGIITNTRLQMWITF